MDITLAWSRAASQRLAIAALTYLLLGCAAGLHGSASTPELARARAAYAEAAADPRVLAHATDALAQAKQALSRAEDAAAQGADPQEQAHLAYVAERRVDIAQARGREGAAKQEIEALMRKRSQSTERLQPPSMNTARSGALTAHAKAQGAREAALAAELAQSQRRSQTGVTQQQLESDLAALEIDTKVTNRGLVATLEDSLFEGAAPRDSMRPKLDPIVAFLKAHLTRQIIIEGFTDAHMPVAESLSLSQARAAAVEAELVAEGIARDRIVVRGYGPDFPIATNDTVEGRQHNRRVEVVITPPGHRALQQLR